MRELEFNPLEKKRLIDKIRQTVERVHFLEREIVKLERRVDASKATCKRRSAQGLARASRNSRKSKWPAK
jgi:hypothetical protein